MKNTPSALQSPTEALSGRAFGDAWAGWLLYGDLEGWSSRTTEDRRYWLERLTRFLSARNMAFDANGLRAFFHALTRADAAAGCKKTLTPASILHVHVLLKALGSWLVEEDILADNPMKRIPRPILRDEGIDPYTDEELRRILAAARQTRNGKRDLALVLFLADTGVRASELCDMRLSDVDLMARTAQVRQGKGGKARMTAFGKQTAQAIWRYLRAEPREADDPLFISEHSGCLTPNGLAQLMRRIGRDAGVAKVHPHRFRHDAAVRLLRNGAHVFAVARLLGHTRITTTEVYVKLAEADVKTMHRLASPMDHLKGR